MIRHIFLSICFLVLLSRFFTSCASNVVYFEEIDMILHIEEANFPDDIDFNNHEGEATIGKCGLPLVRLRIVNGQMHVDDDQLKRLRHMKTFWCEGALNYSWIKLTLKSAEKHAKNEFKEDYMHDR